MSSRPKTSGPKKKQHSRTKEVKKVWTTTGRGGGGRRHCLLSNKNSKDRRRWEIKLGGQGKIHSSSGSDLVCWEKKQKVQWTKKVTLEEGELESSLQLNGYPWKKGLRKWSPPENCQKQEHNGNRRMKLSYCRKKTVGNAKGKSLGGRGRT